MTSEEARALLDPERTGLVEVVVTPTGPIEATVWRAAVRLGAADESGRVIWREAATATGETAGEARAAAVRACLGGGAS